MLLLVGLGLDLKDISVKALEAIEKADKIFYEAYTAFMSDEYLGFIEEKTGKKPIMLQRSGLEENLSMLVSESKDANIALLIIGDPLIATTHHIVLDAADKAGIKTQVFHSSSVYSSAIGESRLDIYKFGATTTIPFWSEKYKPTSFLDVIKRNFSNGMHTLVLLDVDKKTGTSMQFSEAIRLLGEAEKEKAYGIIREDTKLLFLGDVGKKTQLISYVSPDAATKLGKVSKCKMRCIIVPSKLNFAEEESVSKFEP